MADLSITPADVVIVENVNQAEGIASVAIAAGEMCYRVSGTSYALAEAGDTEAKATAPVMALSSGAAGQPIKFAAGGRITVGGGVALGDVFALSATPGKLAPIADLDTGDYFTHVAVGVAAGVIELRPLSTGMQF